MALSCNVLIIGNVELGILLYSLIWCCDKTPNNDLFWGNLTWHARCCHWSFWALKMFSSPFFILFFFLRKKKSTLLHALFPVYTPVILLCCLWFIFSLMCSKWSTSWFYYCWTSAVVFFVSNYFFLWGSYNLGNKLSSTLLSTVSRLGGTAARTREAERKSKLTFNFHV